MATLPFGADFRVSAIDSSYGPPTYWISAPSMSCNLVLTCSILRSGTALPFGLPT